MKKQSVKVKVSKKAAVKAVRLIGVRVALISGSKGQAFRLGDLYSNGDFKLTQNNVGLKYDGALVPADSSKWDKQTRIEIGDYIAARGERAKVQFLTIEQAKKLASKKVQFERNGKTITAKYSGSTGQQYVATIEPMKKGDHFFQLETKRIKGRNEKHYGAVISGDKK